MTIKRVGITLLQILVTVGILVWIFHKPETRDQMAAALSKADIGWIIIGVVVVGIGEYAILVRWWLFLKVQKIDIGWVRTTYIFLISLLFNLFLFGTAGGDLVRILYLAQENPKYAGPGFLSVLMDRLSAFMPLVIVAFAFTWWKYDWLVATPIAAGSLWVMIIFLASLTLLMIASFVVTGFNLLDRMPRWVPCRAKMIEMGDAYHDFARAWKESVWGFFLSAFSMFTYFAAFYCAARAFHYDLPFWDFCALMPTITVIVALPVSVSGLGVREKLFEELLGALFGVPAEIAVLISLVGFLVYLFWSLLGVLPYLLYRPAGHHRVSLHELSEEMEHPHQPETQPKG